MVSIAKDNSFKPEGVLLNLTVQLSGEKPANEEYLKEELAHSLEAASSEISLANASVSPIIQKVEDVQGKNCLYLTLYLTLYNLFMNTSFTILYLKVD